MNNIELINSFEFKVHTSPITLFMRYFLLILIIDILLVIMFLLIDFVIKTWNWFINSFTYEESIIMLSMFIYLIIFFILFIKWFLNYYDIKKWNITHHKWIFFKRKEVYIISDINRIEMRQGIIWRLFDYWDIVVWYNDSRALFKNIQYPSEFLSNVNLIKSQIKL